MLAEVAQLAFGIGEVECAGAVRPFELFDYLTLWGQALGGQLPLVNVIVFASLAVFWVFLTVKAVEARKWG